MSDQPPEKAVAVIVTASDMFDDLRILKMLDRQGEQLAMAEIRLGLDRTEVKVVSKGRSERVDLPRYCGNPEIQLVIRELCNVLGVDVAFPSIV